MNHGATAEVRLHGRRVGDLRFDRGGAIFSYEDDLAQPDHEVLGQVFEDDPRTVRRSRIGIPPWFANLLPEGEMKRQVIRDLGGGNIGDYSILAHLGSYLPGAVTVHPQGNLPTADLLDDPLEAPSHPLRHSQV
ncbi:HipA N-terminal domain-containing protein [Fodinicola feengrottensis]|uniref:HipA N-terminal subdomain 1 domain-containing protein n=1 Tax=Fodinicola feengrottensis TaxID=435914 RepID=A0ABP4V754_9ACTN|nr:HipA N-terminal domain-containing protein [Fodinicola feengrottensis]